VYTKEVKMSNIINKIDIGSIGFLIVTIKKLELYIYFG